MPQLHEQHTCTVVLLYMESWWCRARTLALKIQVKYEWAWSHHGWVIVTCQASPESNYGQPLWKSYGWDDKQKSPVCTHRQKDLSCINMLKTMQSMSELGSLQKHKSIKNVRIFCWIWLLYGQRNDCTHVHAHTHMQTPHTHTQTHTSVHTHTYMSAHRHTHTHKHVHTPVSSATSPCITISLGAKPSWLTFSCVKLQASGEMSTATPCSCPHNMHTCTPTSLS